MILSGASKLRSLVIGSAFLAVAGATQNWIRGLGTENASFVPPPAAYLGTSVDPRIIKRFLGVRLLAADLLWIDAQFKSDLVREKKDFTTFYKALRTVTQLDPDNVYAYYFGGLYLSVVKDDIKGASAILRDGVRYIDSHEHAWADAWQVPFLLGFNLFYEEHEFEEGAKWMRRAAEMPNVPAHVKRLAERVATERGQLELASRLLSDFYRRALNEEAKKKIESRMLDIAARQEIIELNEKFGAYLRSTEAFAFPKKRQLQLFLRAMGRPHNKDLLGRELGIGPTGKIEPVK